MCQAFNNEQQVLFSYFLRTGALILLMLYTYQYFAENAFALVKCVPVRSVNKELLFIDANVECYQGWQVCEFMLQYNSISISHQLFEGHNLKIFTILIRST